METLQTTSHEAREGLQRTSASNAKGSQKTNSEEGGLRLADLPSDRQFWRDDDGYEPARRAAVINSYTPPRYLEVIIQVSKASEVVDSLRFAAAHGFKVAVRSGGHSWSGNHLRDGGMLLDLSQLDQYTIDRENMTAVVATGTHGHVLALELEKVKLFFPTGHAIGVGLGGYLLQGGFGWNGRALGPACESVIGLDVVTADGVMRYIDADNDRDLFWAARGSGVGFFAVVTAFHVRLHKAPAFIGHRLDLYSAEQSDEIYTWARTVDLDTCAELQIIGESSFRAFGLETPGIIIWAPVFAESEEAAKAVVSVLDDCPASKHVVRRIPFAPATMKELYDIASHAFREGWRAAVDGMFTSASAAELIPKMRYIHESMPPEPTHSLWMLWAPRPARQDMVFSMEDDVYIALNTVWYDPDDDAKYGDWARATMADMESLSTGMSLADENLGARPAKFLADESLRRLDAIRAVYDPNDLFHSFMSRLS